MKPFDGKYLSLTSFKRDGTGVATPVWFVSDNGHLLVETDADSYKVKRIRRDAHVRIALCDARGRIHERAGRRRRENPPRGRTRDESNGSSPRSTGSTATRSTRSTGW